MQKIAIIQISEAGKDIANTLQRELGAKTITRTEIGKHWDEFDAFVFIGAMGICVRTIAPYIKDKHEAIELVPLFANVSTLNDFGTKFVLERKGNVLACFADLYDGYLLHFNMVIG